MGFLQGYAAKSLECPQCEKALTSGIWYNLFSHGTIYNVFYVNHLFLILPLVFLVLGKFVKKELWSQIICFISLIIATAIYWHTYLVKLNYIDELGSDGPHWYSTAARNASVLDEICLTLLALLFVYQIVALIQHIRHRKQRKSF